MLKICNCLTDFGKGIIAGFLLSAILFGVVIGLMLHHAKVQEIVENAERQQIIETMREDYINRDPIEFLEVPGVRGAVDGAAADFERRRDEVIQRFRDRLTD